MAMTCEQCGKQREKGRRYCQPCARARRAEANRRSAARLREQGYWQQHYQENREQYRENTRRWQQANPEKARESRRKSRRPWVPIDPTIRRDRYLRRTYGISLADYERMAASGCAICTTTAVRLVVDHNHSTGRVRGVLCDRCNTALAHEDPSWLLAAAGYLQQHQAQDEGRGVPL